MVNACNGNTTMDSHLGIIIDKIKSIQQRFQVYTNRHIPHDHNYLVHIFAWHDSDIVLWESILDFSHLAFWLDCNSYID